jgi:tetratricopeptide (TPR) repeat protein
MRKKSSAKTQPAPKVSNIREGRNDRLCIAAIGIFVLARLLCALLPHASLRIWGLDVAGYLLPGLDAYLALLLPMLLFVKSVRTKAAKVLASLFSSGSIVSSAYILVPALTGLIILSAENAPVLFPFLGDGAYYQTEIFRLISDPNYSSSLIKATSFLTGIVLEWITRLIMPESAVTPYLISGYASCAIVVGGIFMIIPREKPALRFLALGFLISSGAVLFFFGYTELYTFQYSFAFLFVIALMHRMDGEGLTILPGIFLLVSILFGASSLLFLPAYLYFLATRTSWLKEKPGLAIFWLFIVLQIAAVIALYLFIGDELHQHYLTPVLGMDLSGPSYGFEGSYTYGILSMERLLDMLNVILLNASVFAALLPVLLYMAYKKKFFGASAQVFVMMAFSGLLALTTAMSSFGLTRDWDFASIPVLAIVSLSLYLLHSFHQNKIIDVRNILPIILMAGISSTYVWVAVNAGDESVQRFEDAVTRDADMLSPHATYAALENLRKYHSGTDNIPKKHETLKKIIENDYRSWEAFEELLWDTAVMEETPAQSEQFSWILTELHEKASIAVGEDHYRYVSQERLGEIVASVIYVSVKHGNAVELAVKAIAAMQDLLPEWPERAFLRFVVLQEIPSENERMMLLESVRTDADEPILTMAMGDYLFQSGELLAAIPYYERTLELAPSKYPDVYFSLARLLEESSGSIEKSVTVLERFLQHCKFDSRVPQVLSLINMQKEMQR